MWTIRLWRSFFPDYTRKKEKTNVSKALIRMVVENQ